MVYWAVEYGKVFIAYMALMYIWPMVVFRKYLAPKSRTYRFAFCSTVQVVIVNTVVLLLGLVHLLNRWTMILVFYGVFIGSILWKRKFNFAWLENVKQVLIGTRGIKLFLSQTIVAMKRIVGRGIKYVWNKTKGHRIEYLSLLVVVVFGMIYFSYAAFAEPSYGTSDMYVHHAWVYGLKQGKIFSGGIYPEGMHCFVYALNALLGVDVYSCMLFLAGIYISTLLISIYCFCKEVMNSRYTGILSLALFLTLDLVNFNEITSMSRLQWTLPQEFGFYTMFLGALYLVRYLRSERTIRKENGKIKWIVWDENLFIFVLAVAGSFSVHFYVTIMAFFVCVPFAIVGIRRIFHKGNFRSLVAGVSIGIIIAAIPMGAAYAAGMQFQGSIGWALEVIKGSSNQQTDTEVDIQPTEQLEATESIPSDMSSTEVSLSREQTTTGTYVSVQKQISMKQKIQAKLDGVCFRVKSVAGALYENTYQYLYGDRAKWIILFTIIGAGLGVICFIVKSIVKKKIVLDGYLGITLATIVFMFAYSPRVIGLPSLVDSIRLCSTAQILIITMMMIPVDLLFALLQHCRLKILLPELTMLGVIGIYFGTNYFGVYHGYLYISMTRYEAAAEVTNEINHKFPKQSYTIVSPTDELYQVIENGWHEEIVTLFREMQYGTYSVPTEYLFFYVEKQPMLYAQYHFMTGPDWLAKEKYAPYSPSSITSEGTTYIHSDISMDAAEMEMPWFSRLSDTYKDYNSRNIVESKLYAWCEKLMKEYPHEMNVYYEDDKFICYVVKQNTYRLLNLENK